MTENSNRDWLTDRVRRLLGDVLRQTDFPGCEDLLHQASDVTVVGGPITMLELRSKPSAQPSAFTDGPIPVSIVVLDAADELIGELIVWVERGFLACLEFAWWTDDAPDELPASDRVRVDRK